MCVSSDAVTEDEAEETPAGDLIKHKTITQKTQIQNSHRNLIDRDILKG